MVEQKVQQVKLSQFSTRTLIGVGRGYVPVAERLGVPMTSITVLPRRFRPKQEKSEVSGVSDASVQEKRRVNKKRRSIRSRIGAAGLTFLLAGGTAVLDAGCNSGSGNLQSITVAGHQVPSDFVDAISAASQVCNAVTPQVLAGLTMKESTFNDWDTNYNKVS